MVQQLWAPWRLAYVTGETKPASGCVLCAKRDDPAEQDALVLARGERCYVVMNLYPYNNGHMMVVPNRHVADPTELDDDEALDLHRMLARSLRAVRQALGAEGANVGLNVGEAGGAGIAAHQHWHVVPRWQGDTNFMPVLAETKVMPQHLQTTWRALRDAFDQLD
jgi:ATP adenylyltransferase